MKLMLRVRHDGLPVAMSLASANQSENRLAESLLDNDTQIPDLLLADRGFDDDQLHDRFAARGVFLIAPHRRNRKLEKRHDGRHLRRYWRRNIVERTNSWLQTFRRFVVRYEYYSFLFLGFVSLGCLILVARKLGNHLYEYNKTNA